LLLLAEGRDIPDRAEAKRRTESALTEARQCCARALGLDNEDEQSRALAHKLICDIDAIKGQAKL